MKIKQSLWMGVNIGIRVYRPNNDTNLPAVIALMSRDKNGPKLVLQLLAYLVTDVSNFDTQSYNKFQDSFILTKNAMQ